MKRRICILLILLAPIVRAEDAGQALHGLFEAYDAWEMREFPELAMSRGDYTHADRITDVSLTAVERRHHDGLKRLETLRAIDPARLSADDRLHYALFERLLQDRIDGHRFRMFLAPVGPRSGPHQIIPQMHERVRFDSAEDYAHYLDRLDRVPKMIDDTIELLRLGVRERRTPPRVTLKGVDGQFETLLGGGLAVLAEPFERKGDHADLRERFDRVTMPALHIAMRRFRDYLVNDYIPNCTTSIAATDLPDGEAYYAYALRRHTTTGMSARQIHDLGQSEVTRIKAEMMVVIRGSDFMSKEPATVQMADDELFKSFIRYLRTDPRFYFDSPDELLRGYRDICKRIDAHMPALFKTLPRLPYGVQAIPAFMAPTQTTAYYQHGDIRNAQAGNFFANTYALDQRPKYEMIALALHEAVPGHHHQIALAQEIDGLPEFRKHLYHNAFGEGWALYCERLGIEMGLYDDPYDDFGRLLYEMWRACRLVVDPGMHAFGWSREDAVRFMRDNTALSELNINSEVDRYIAWPGQACSYKIGELTIRRLRKRAERRLGPAFDIRAFHDVVLSAGSLPLDTLEARVDDWLTRVASAGQTH